MQRSMLDVLRLPLDRLPDPLLVPCAGGAAIDASFVPPGSKSLTNRVLPLAALGSGVGVIERALLDADDAQRMIGALRALGVRVEPERAGGVLRVHGVEGRWRQPAGGVTLDLGNAGTATRFLGALACLGDPAGGAITIDGNARMRERPIGELVDMLRSIGVRVEEIGRNRCPPIRVHPVGDLGGLGCELEVGATASSQFVSAMMMLGSFLPRGLRIRFGAPATSAAYIEMTIGLMRRLGVAIEGDPSGEVLVRGWEGRGARGGVPVDLRYAVEPDASNASYFLALGAAIPGASVACEGLGDSLQGDARFAEWLERMGARVEVDGTTDSIRVVGGAALRGIEAYGSLMPDAAMTLAALATLAKGATTIHGLRTLRVKETDRLAALRTELGKTGAAVEIFSERGGADEGLRIVPPSGGIVRGAGAPGISFDTYDDHRMAMSCAIVAAVRGNARINDPRCVAKTYPSFWSALAGVLGSGSEGGRAD
ncbi:MAG: 3-phosphoshikimate 1-carboxyvinyltransferase [Phycisphaerales bacterium]